MNNGCIVQLVVSETDLIELLFASFRYALGRKTSVVYVVSTLLGKYKVCLPEPMKEQMCTEIRNAIDNDRAGMQCDIDEGIKLMTILQ